MIRDEAVKAKTGKNWTEWLRVLDKAGCKKMTHKEIALFLHEKHKLPGWWCQMVAVGYEQERGLRVKNQSCLGDFQVSNSKTVPVSVRDLFEAWENPKRRAAWLADPDFVIRKATRPKSMRITWIDGKTHVDANFYAKGSEKSFVAVQHRKLADAKSVDKMRKYWTNALAKLDAKLRV